MRSAIWSLSSPGAYPAPLLMNGSARVSPARAVPADSLGSGGKPGGAGGGASRRVGDPVDVGLYAAVGHNITAWIALGAVSSRRDTVFGGRKGHGAGRARLITGRRKHGSCSWSARPACW